MPVRLAHVCIETADLDATENFYALLGMRRRFEFRNRSGALVGFYLAFDNLTFIEVIEVRDPAPVGRLRHFAIEVDDVDDARARLAAGGIEVSEKRLARDRQWMITCNDPNGIFIELQQYTEDSMQRVGGVCEVDYDP